ncbi:MAG: ATP/GTP-binding protein [Thermoplasmata archaeon]
MEEPATVYFTGTAGAGKTTLVQAYGAWLKSAGYDATIVNLDPGSEATDFEPDVDVREWVRLADVMDEYGLGPNGAQVAAADLITIKIFEIKQAVQELKTDYVLVDTPGQVELFAFRESSKAMVEALSGDRSAIVFLFDPALALRPTGYVSLLMLAATVEFRLRLPMLHVLSKADMLPPDRLAQFASWVEDSSALYEALTAETPTPDLQMSTEVFRALESMGALAGTWPVSAKEGTGLETFYRSCQAIFAGSEDLEPSHAPSEG